MLYHYFSEYIYLLSINTFTLFNNKMLFGRYGLHKLTFKGVALWVHYRPLLGQGITNNDFREQITIFADLTEPIRITSPEVPAVVYLLKKETYIIYFHFLLFSLLKIFDETRNGTTEEEPVEPSAPPATSSPSPTSSPIASPSLSHASPPSITHVSHAHEVLNWFLLNANEYQHKTENDYVVVLSINEDTLKVHYYNEIT